MASKTSLFYKLKTGRLPTTALVLELVGFGLVAGAIWLNHVFDFSHRLFGGADGALGSHEALWEAGLVLMLGAVVTFFTVRTARHLESLISICAWCHQVKLEDRWMSVEEFLANHRSETTHGICEACAARWEAEMAAPATPE